MKRITKHDHWQSSNTGTITLKAQQQMPDERLGAHARALKESTARYQTGGTPRRVKRLRVAWLNKPAGLSPSGNWRSK